MQVKKILNVVYVAGVCAAFVISPLAFSRAWAVGNASDFVKEIKLFEQVASYVRQNYVKEVDASKTIHDAIRGLLSGLDEYTVFMEADEFRLLLNDTEGSFGGLGIEIAVTPEDKTLTVMNVIEGTPAERVGLKTRDKIIEISGVTTEGITTRDALLKLRGEPGTDVKIGVARKDRVGKLEFTITREIIHTESVPYHFMATEEVGYIRVTSFSRDDTRSTSKDFALAADDLKSQGMRKLIIDMRGNPGGSLDEAVALASYFLKEDATVVSTKGRSKQWKERDYRVEGEPKYKKEPVVILVDDSSASASEVFTGAMKDHKRAKVLGEKTFGKASVQTIIPLSTAADQEPGPGLKMTIAYYYTPNGSLIQGKGIEPDQKLEAEKVPLVVARLYEEGLLRLYAEVYHDAHGEAAGTDFQNDPRAYEGFRDWVQGKDFDFYPEEYAKTLPDNGREFALAAMDKERSKLVSLLTREIIREMDGDAAAFRYWREYDPWIDAAVTALK